MATTQNKAEVSDDKIERLQGREKALLAEAKKLRARAEHLERVRHSYSSHLRRRQDTHEKVVLGALAKIAGLDAYHYDPLPPKGLKTKAPLNSLDSLADTYDRELILGAMMWLAQSIKQDAGDMVSIPSLAELQTVGRETLTLRSGTDK